MNCENARPKLQDLLEGTLSPRAAKPVLAHLEACQDCRREKALLALVARSAAALPARRPSPAFDARVLAAAALARKAAAPCWAAWLLNFGASVTVLWTAVLAAFLRPRLGVSGLLNVSSALLHPAAALSAAELRVAEAGLSLPEALRAARHAATVVARIHFVPGSALSALPLQCVLAALIAGAAVAAAARPRRDFAVSRRNS